MQRKEHRSQLEGESAKIREGEEDVYRELPHTQNRGSRKWSVGRKPKKNQCYIDTRPSV